MSGSCNSSLLGLPRLLEPRLKLRPSTGPFESLLTFELGLLVGTASYPWTLAWDEGSLSREPADPACEYAMRLRIMASAVTKSDKMSAISMNRNTY